MYMQHIYNATNLGSLSHLYIEHVIRKKSTQISSTFQQLTAIPLHLFQLQEIQEYL